MNKMVRQLLPFTTLILIISILSLLKPDTFLTLANFLNVLRRSSVNGIISVGMTMVIISAGIDLSVGSMLALSGMAGAYTMILLGGGKSRTSSSDCWNSDSYFHRYLLRIIKRNTDHKAKSASFYCHTGYNEYFSGDIICNE